MSRKGFEVEVEFTPYVCSACGQLQIASDMVSRGTPPGNCDNPDCPEDQPILKAGPRQWLSVRITKAAKAHFDKGNSKPIEKGEKNA